MKIVLAFAVLWLTVGASGQQSQESTGEIHGTVVGHGRSAKGMLLSAVMECPSICSFWMTQTVTDQDGEYRFQHLPLGMKYSVFADNTKAGYPRFGPGPAGTVELTASHPEASLAVTLRSKGVVV